MEERPSSDKREVEAVVLSLPILRGTDPIGGVESGGVARLGRRFPPDGFARSKDRVSENLSVKVPKIYLSYLTAKG